jgi:hypothetical protein
MQPKGPKEPLTTTLMILEITVYLIFSSFILEYRILFSSS